MCSNVHLLRVNCASVRIFALSEKQNLTRAKLSINKTNVKLVAHHTSIDQIEY